MTESASPSENNAPTVERLAIEEVTTRRKSPRPGHLRLFESKQPPDGGTVLSETSPPPQVSPPVMPPADRSAVVLEVFRAMALVLSARALILVFGLCGFAIALVGALRESREVLYAFLAWNLLTVIPLIVLDVVTRRRE